MADHFDELVAEADAASVDGWDFGWLDGRATEQRPSWGYARSLAGRLGRARAVLEVQTGGGEVFAEALAAAPARPTLAVATESWPPNLARATRLLKPHGVAVVHDPDEPPLPFADGTFDLVTSRHPVTAWWADIARVLAPGGTYFSQQVGPASVYELVEYFLGEQPSENRNARHPDQARDGLRAAGLEVVDLRCERRRIEFFDIGAVVWFLRKVIWMVPGFTVEEYRGPLRRLHDQIQAEGPFVAHSSRMLVEARKP
ncbi:class I SAM-dependent methyltransferase [Pseudonocardia eucalypti]|uniref:Class I SAM-dependent methyltransferase n=1 Tax=Pseudonocardia eucalypti TaxID=648755 RepID=A0ABP9Q1R7_9PSEU|nr:SAM-dependent methyltransferase [Pseudonocardia eucalypti]